MTDRNPNALGAVPLVTPPVPGGNVKTTRTLLAAPLLVVLAFWFAVLFAAYSMYAEINAVSIVALMICAASVAGAMFLLFQMNNPFTGIMAIPRVDLLAMLPPL